MQRYDVSLVEAVDKDGQGRHTSAAWYSVSAEAGRTFLRDRLEPERKGTLPFLKLPAELRNEIYELVFTFPKAGFGWVYAYEPHSLWTRIILPNRIEEDDADLQNAYTNRSDYALAVYAPQTSNILRLLLTCRRIYKEAVPFFYRVNHFHFHNTETFGKAISRLAASRIPHLSSLSLILTVCHYTSLRKFVPAMKALTAIKSLRRLVISA